MAWCELEREARATRLKNDQPEPWQNNFLWIMCVLPAKQDNRMYAWEINGFFRARDSPVDGDSGLGNECKPSPLWMPIRAGDDGKTEAWPSGLRRAARHGSLRRRNYDAELSSRGLFHINSTLQPTGWATNIADNFVSSLWHVVY